MSRKQLGKVFLPLSHFSILLEYFYSTLRSHKLNDFLSCPFFFFFFFSLWRCCHLQGISHLANCISVNTIFHGHCRCSAGDYYIIFNLTAVLKQTFNSAQLLKLQDHALLLFQPMQIQRVTSSVWGLASV